MLLRPIEFSVKLHLIKLGYHCTYARLGPVAQSVIGLTADLGVANLIPAQSHTFTEIM